VLICWDALQVINIESRLKMQTWVGNHGTDATSAVYVLTCSFKVVHKGNTMPEDEQARVKLGEGGEWQIQVCPHSLTAVSTMRANDACQG
jgi:hypothetical protein